MSADSVADKNIAIWKVKKLIKSLEMARGYEAFRSKRDGLTYLEMEQV
jgi:hypothetical protein